MWVYPSNEITSNRNHMTIQIDTKEIYLLERFTSLEYFGELRDKWERMVKHVEKCLELFMNDLPSNYRRRSLPDQPDVVWGGLVLPNFRSTLSGLHEGYILWSHNNVRGLHFAHGPLTDHKGQMDYWSGWMNKDDEALYISLVDECAEMAHKITVTERAGWRMLRLLPFAKNISLPDLVKHRRYKINTNVSVRTGEKAPASGIYVPDTANCGAQFLSTRYDDAPPAKEYIGKEDVFLPSGEKYDEKLLFENRNCTWYLVERDFDAEKAQENIQLVARSAKVRGGDTCPESGFYITPAQADSRQYFQKGGTMPSYDSDFGMTIWQWDENQQ